MTKGPDQGEEYVCAYCHQEFTATAPDAEARAEYEQTFGVTMDEVPADVICDDCYIKLMNPN